MKLYHLQDYFVKLRKEMAALIQEKELQLKAGKEGQVKVWRSGSREELAADGGKSTAGSEMCFLWSKAKGPSYSSARL